MGIFSAENAINSFGLIGIFTILFVETGLPVVLGLPGDSLLFLAGVSASGTGAKLNVHLSLTALVIGTPIAAILGSQFGHWLGDRYGVKLFQNPNSKYFNPKRLATMKLWVDKYGMGKMIFLGRFIPIVRHLVNPVSGILQFPHRKFFFWNVVSALVWTQSFIWGGYYLGEKLKGSVDHYILPIVAVIVLLSISPIIWEVYKRIKDKEKRK
jgi:membrane-associated protein